MHHTQSNKLSEPLKQMSLLAVIVVTDSKGQKRDKPMIQ